MQQIKDDRTEIELGDPVLSIVEDDPHYARIILELARDKGFKALIATRGIDAPLSPKSFGRRPSH